MVAFDNILLGFEIAFQPHNIWYVFLGAILGTVIGILPGIGPSAGVAILLPITFGLEPVSALILLAGIYYGAMYSNTAAAVLINTPGTASAAMTTLDGYPMARAGRGGAALAIAAIASFVAGTLGIVLLSVFAQPLAEFALDFGPAQYFTLMLFALTAVSSFTDASLTKGLMAAALGLAIATVGIDLQTGVSRYTMGILQFQDGVPFVVVIVGLFAVSEVLINVERWFSGEAKPIVLKGKLWLDSDEARRSVGPTLRGGLIGFIVGVLPGAGGTIATVLAYSMEKKISRHPERFGRGAAEGVAAPEAANNASTSGAFVPLLTLGVPGSGTTAVLLGAFILHGIQPGPAIFNNHPDVVWGLINSMYLGNVMMLLLTLPLIGVFIRILYIPPGTLFALILTVATVGIYSVDQSPVQLYVMLFFGVLGYLFRKAQVPAPPLILALVLGGMMEQSFRQSLSISRGSIDIFFNNSISLTLLIMTAFALFAPVVIRRITSITKT